MARVIRQQELRSNVPAPDWGDPQKCLDRLNFHPKPLAIADDKRVVFVRTTPDNELKMDGLIIVAKQFHDGRGMGAHIGAQVLAVPPGSDLKVGDHVVFERLDFAWTHRLPDGTLVGWVREIQIYFALDEDHDGADGANGEPGVVSATTPEPTAMKGACVA